MENMQNSHHAGHSSEHGTHNTKHASAMYKRFAVMAVAMFAVMYFIMYAMIDRKGTPDRPGTDRAAKKYT
jgi:hypothetical protein